MPFMKGPAPVRRTLKYLEAGNIIFRDSIRIMAVNYNIKKPCSEGTRKFVYWQIPQIQHQNPHVQIVLFKNITPTPFISFYFMKPDHQSYDRAIYDCYNKEKDEIEQHVRKVFGKSDVTLQRESLARMEKANPANFGNRCDRNCICEVPTQVSCTGFKLLPQFMRGKYKWLKKEELAEVRAKVPDEKAFEEYWQRPY